MYVFPHIYLHTYASVCARAVVSMCVCVHAEVRTFFLSRSIVATVVVHAILCSSTVTTFILTLIITNYDCYDSYSSGFWTHLSAWVPRSLLFLSLAKPSTVADGALCLRVRHPPGQKNGKGLCLWGAGLAPRWLAWSKHAPSFSRSSSLKLATPINPTLVPWPLNLKWET